jgi:hypothetical protein
VCALTVGKSHPPCCTTCPKHYGEVDQNDGVLLHSGDEQNGADERDDAEFGLEREQAQQPAAQTQVLNGFQKQAHAGQVADRGPQTSNNPSWSY